VSRGRGSSSRGRGERRLKNTRGGRGGRSRGRGGREEEMIFERWISLKEFFFPIF
jgi:hypothetical protein